MDTQLPTTKKKKLSQHKNTDYDDDDDDYDDDDDDDDDDEILQNSRDDELSLSFDTDEEDNEDDTSQSAVSFHQHFLTVPNMTTFQAFQQPADSQTGDSSSDTYTWTVTPPKRVKIPFSGNSDIKVKLSGTTPLHFFFMLFTDELLRNIVHESNKYAMNVLANSAKIHSRIKKFRNITVDEMKTFLGIFFFMGLIRLNRLGDYWRTHYLFRLSVRNFLSRDRFLLILRVLQFSVANENGNDKLKKIQPLIEFFNSKMDEIYTPERELSLDECMVLWKGHLVFKSCLTGNRGIKLYALSEPKGLVQKLHVYAGEDIMENKNHASKIVYKLLEGQTGKGHALYMDSSYSSVTLFDELLKLDTYCTGTLLAEQKDLPPVIETNLKPGEIVASYNSSGVCIAKWKHVRDKKDILIISSEFEAKYVAVTNKRGFTVKKPQIIVEYNKNMKGVEKHEQMLSYYPTCHKTMTWSKKLAIHIFHIMLKNSYFLHNKYTGRKMDLHDFQLEICQNLLPDPDIPIIKQPTSAVHLPSLLPKGANNKTKRKHCKLCAQKLKKRRDCIYYCSLCPNSPGLCLIPCFKEFHNY